MHLFETAKYPGSRRDPLRWLRKIPLPRLLLAKHEQYIVIFSLNQYFFVILQYQIST